MSDRTSRESIPLEPLKSSGSGSSQPGSPNHDDEFDDGILNQPLMSAKFRDLEAAKEIRDDEELDLEESSGQPRKISPWIMIPLWITLSSSVIILNKHIFTKMHFPYPVFLTAFHMAVATIGTQILRRTTSLLDQTNQQPMDFQTYTRSILPLGVLFSASLVLSNTAYVYLSVSFVQMLKAFIPVLVHLMSWSIGLAHMDTTIGVILSLISVGCVIAALGELTFSTFGVICQGLAVVVESARLVAVQVLIGKQKLSPLVLVYLYAPLCFLFISILQPMIEGPQAYADLHNVGIPIMMLSGGLAFALNVAGVYLIHSAGSLVLTLSGVLKDIILIVLAVMLGSVMTLTQAIGYGIALVGLVWFKRRGCSPPDKTSTAMGEGASTSSSLFTRLLASLK